MNCQVGWIDCHNTETFHAHPTPAIGYAVFTGPVDWSIRGPHRHPVCAEHYETLSQHRDHHQHGCTHRTSWYRTCWHFEPFYHV